MHKKIALFALILILTLVNWSIYQKEMHIKHGSIVYLKLAPVDPRSLMQGDYMALRFDIAEKIYAKLPKHDSYQGWRHNANAIDGFVVVHLDKKRVARFVRLYQQEALKSNEILMQYRVRNGAVKFATNAFFFQEGTAKRYEKAKYGMFKINDKGALLLIGMADATANSIQAINK